MKLRLREKRDFYRELERLFRAGRAFPDALEIMQENTRGQLGKFLRGLHGAALRGDTVAEAFARSGAVSQMEISMLEASERAGRIDHACAQLSSYFGALEQARATVAKRALYPTFLLHFGVFVLAAPKLAMGGSVMEYARQTIGFLLLIYAAVLLAWIIGEKLSRAGETSVAIDSALRAVPLFGKVRRSFALARFCATYDAQLGAGVNVFDVLTSAGQASRSALVMQAVRKALPEVRGGSKVGPLLQNSRAFPAAMARAFRVGEETGELDLELSRLAEEFEREALSRVETLSDWIPKIAYFCVALYIAWQIVSVYSGMAAGYEKALDF
ncbi:MAG: type pilus assembly protein PilC [Chthoniobacter sp.]|nr:type pilus assembly protein PilC [Chthoniobacter sp.]